MLKRWEISLFGEKLVALFGFYDIILSWGYLKNYLIEKQRFQ